MLALSVARKHLELCYKYTDKTDPISNAVPLSVPKKFIAYVVRFEKKNMIERAIAHSYYLALISSIRGKY